jgi:Cu(I)/Ag(I) efflux system membrane fusion protein
MTPRALSIGLALLLTVGLTLGWWWTTVDSTSTPPGERRETTSTHEAMPGVGHPGEQPGSPEQAQTEGTASSPESTAPTVTIPPERLQTIGVKFEEVTQRPLEKVIRTVGRIEIDERRLERVNLKLAGWIDQLAVSAIGDHVTKGQSLFTIYSPDLVATQEEYLLALQSVQELGQSEFPEVARGAQDLLEATRRRFQLWDITEDHIHELEKTGQVLKTLPIHSPMTGTVIRMEARKGTYVSPGTELYMIADLSSIWVLADIYEYELPSIKIDQSATVTLSYDPRTKLQGHVAFIYPTLDPKTRTAKVRFELENSGEKLKPDMYANVEIKIPLGTQVAIPDGAVVNTGLRKVVFVDRGQGKLEPREVQVGDKVENAYVVESGLRSGERVVTSAAFLIDSESQLRSALGMMGMHGMDMGSPPSTAPSGPAQHGQGAMEGMAGMKH